MKSYAEHDEVGASRRLPERTQHHAPRCALLFTMHSWKSFRSAGFHKIGEALGEAGVEVFFFSYPRPWYYALKQGDLYGYRNLYRLWRGDRNRVGVADLINITVPTWEFPPRMGKMFPRLDGVLRSISESRVIKRCRRLRPCPELIVLESTACLRLWPMLKIAFGDARFAYRPSDPILPRPNVPSDLKDAEIEVLKSVDLVLLVNDEARKLYEGHGVLTPEDPRVHLVPNGFDLEAYRKSYPLPREWPIEQRSSVVYVGASGPDWHAILSAARALRDRVFIVVCPVQPLKEDERLIRDMDNILYIPGVPSDRVPEFVANADVIMIPYPENCRTWSRGLHSKVYQAMAAKKPIVGLNMGEQQSKIKTIIYAESVDEFVEGIKNFTPAMVIEHDYDLSSKDWSYFKEGIQRILLDDITTIQGDPSISA